VSIFLVVNFSYYQYNVFESVRNIKLSSMASRRLKIIFSLKKDLVNVQSQCVGPDPDLDPDPNRRIRKKSAFYVIFCYFLQHEVKKK
jgi:hypothetical protein